MLSDSTSFISNNVKRIQSFEKRTKVFEYFKNTITSSGFIFLQETYSTIHDENNGSMSLKGNSFFSHGSSSSCWIAIGFIGNTSFVVSNKKQDESAEF